MNKKIWRSSLILAAIMAMLPFPGNADDPLVSGVLITPGGEPVSREKVIVKGDQFRDSTITDRYGNFLFDALPAGEYTVSLENKPSISKEFKVQEIKPKWWQFGKESQFKSFGGRAITFEIETATE